MWFYWNTIQSGRLQDYLAVIAKLRFFNSFRNLVLQKKAAGEAASWFQP
jgi:hypothetical protein